MTELPAHGTRSSMGALYRTAEDRATFRKWARGCTIAYSIVIVALLAIGFSTRDTRDSRMVAQSQAIGAMAPPPTLPGQATAGTAIIPGADPHRVRSTKSDR